MHRTMKSALKAKLGSDPNWVDALPLVLLGMRAAVKNDLHCSVAEMVFGEPLRLPGGGPASSSCLQMVIWLQIQRLWQTCGSRFVCCDRYLLCGTAVSRDGATYHKSCRRQHTCLCSSDRGKHRCNHRTKGHSKYLKDARNISSWIQATDMTWFLLIELSRLSWMLQTRLNRCLWSLKCMYKQVH